MNTTDRGNNLESAKNNRPAREEEKGTESMVLIELDDMLLAQVGGGHIVKQAPPPVFTV